MVQDQQPIDRLLIAFITCSITRMLTPCSRTFLMIAITDSISTRGQTGHDFVEEQQLRAHGERLGQFQALAVRTAKRVSALIGAVRETYEIELFMGECPRARRSTGASPRSE